MTNSDYNNSNVFPFVYTGWGPTYRVSPQWWRCRRSICFSTCSRQPSCCGTSTSGCPESNSTNTPVSSKDPMACHCWATLWTSWRTLTVSDRVDVKLLMLTDVVYRNVLFQRYGVVFPPKIHIERKIIIFSFIAIHFFFFLFFPSHFRQDIREEFRIRHEPTTEIVDRTQVVGVLSRSCWRRGNVIFFCPILPSMFHFKIIMFKRS